MGHDHNSGAVVICATEDGPTRPQLAALLRETAALLEAQHFGLGATGQYPHGSLGPHDEGELKVGLVVQQGKVVLNFGQPISFAALTPRQARQLAELLRRRSDQAQGRR